MWCSDVCECSPPLLCPIDQPSWTERIVDIVMQAVNVGAAQKAGWGLLKRRLLYADVDWVCFIVQPLGSPLADAAC